MCYYEPLAEEDDEEDEDVEESTEDSIEVTDFDDDDWEDDDLAEANEALKVLAERIRSGQLVV